MPNEVVKKENREVVSSGIEYIQGIEPEDLNLPYVYIVRPGAKHAKLEDGKSAEPGTFYHSTKKKAYKELEVLLVFAKKGTQEVEKEGEVKEERVWRTLMLKTDNLQSPFSMSFRGMNLWHGWKPFLSFLVAEGIKNPHLKVYKISSTDAQTQDGRSYPVPHIVVVRDSTEEERAMCEEVANRFGNVVDDLKDEDMDEEVDVNEVIGDLDGKI